MSEVLLSQLAHVEIVSPKPADSVRWFVDVLGLEQTTQEGQSAYLRGWGEWLHSSLIVTEGPAPRPSYRKQALADSWRAPFSCLNCIWLTQII